VTRGKGVRPFGEHVDDLILVYFAEITSLCASRFTTIISSGSRRGGSLLTVLLVVAATR
jgi:hypothetical protein